MRRRTLGLAFLVTIGPVGSVASTGRAQVQSGRFAPPPPRQLHLGPLTAPAPVPRGAELETSLRGHFGPELAARLARSDDADQRLEGIERAAEARTSEGLALLVRALDASGAARADARALVAVARGLAAYTSQPEARTALQNIINSPPTTQSFLRAAPVRAAEGTLDETLELGRVELARGTAAVALATSTEARAKEAIVAIARGVGAGQPFAASAILAAPVAQASAYGSSGATTASLIRLLASLGDLRGLEGIRVAVRTGDPATRAAALQALAEMGDARAIDTARAASKDVDPHVRAAAARALVLLGAATAAGAADGPRAVEALVSDDATALAGAHLAELAQDDGVLKALAARVVSSGDLELRRAVVSALGHGTSAAAVDLLARLTRDPILASDAGAALGRSPSDAAIGVIVGLMGAAEGPARRLGARAYVVRAIVRSERDGRARDLLVRMAASGDANDRAVGRAALVALGEQDVAPALADPDPRVRRAVATAALVPLATGDARARAAARALVARLTVEPDAATREALSVGLIDGDTEGRLTTVALLDRAETGGPDAPLAAMAFTLRAEGVREPKVDALLASRDPLVRAHVARGLGGSASRNAIGRLANAYAYEPDLLVRRALVLAMAGRTRDAGSPARKAALDLASRLDPDTEVRRAAARALAGLPAAPSAPHVHEVAWLRLQTGAGGAPAAPVETAALVRSDGVAIPIAFDEDGYALVVVPPGEARLVLAPRVPAYEALGR
jgi:HEAT repeat protein